MAVLGWVYVVLVALLALYGFNALTLTLITLVRRPQEPSPPPTPIHWPKVTVQVPVYNEVHVADRVIRAVGQLRYPRARLEIQVLDDSDDETSEIIAATVARLRRQGVRIQHLRRATREGYKAGALANGLQHAAGEFIAIFDADFVPPRDWLERTVPYLVAYPDVGFVQTRWEHLNAVASAITLAQSLALDGHFAVDQVARQAMGWPVTFNGSAGIWRKACIEAAGGWQGDTLCEDLDLAYRAQLAGWKGLVLAHVSAPGEIPPVVTAFRQQQARWAAGSIQTLRKLAGRLLRARGWSFGARWQGFVHLSNYLVHPLLLGVLALSPLMVVYRPPFAWGLAVLAGAGIGPPLAYTVGQWRLRRSLRRLRAFPVLILLGIGTAWACTVAILQALLNRPIPFARTPKFRSVGRSRQWRNKIYGIYGAIPRFAGMGEAFWAIYALASARWAWHQGQIAAALFLALYAGAFAFTAFSAWDEWHRAREGQKHVVTSWHERPLRGGKPLA